MKANLSNMMSLDIFLNSLSTEDYNKTRLSINDSNTIPLISSDIYLSFFSSLLNKATINKDIDALDQLSKNHHWTNNIESILKNNNFDSLVVTNTSKKIIWVNDGFAKMTGYSKKYALHKTPAFLQGEKTQESSKNKIRTKINSQKPFKEVVWNYKKNKSAYKCELYIFPLRNLENKITHYLALEKEVA